ncbi:hypothetical protein ACKKD7_005125, partial [Escherichia coli]
RFSSASDSGRVKTAGTGEYFTEEDILSPPYLSARQVRHFPADNRKPGYMKKGKRVPDEQLSGIKSR